MAFKWETFLIYHKKYLLSLATENFEGSFNWVPLIVQSFRHTAPYLCPLSLVLLLVGVKMCTYPEFIGLYKATKVIHIDATGAPVQLLPQVLGLCRVRYNSYKHRYLCSHIKVKFNHRKLTSRTHQINNQVISTDFISKNVQDFWLFLKKTKMLAWNLFTIFSPDGLILVHGIETKISKLSLDINLVRSWRVLENVTTTNTYRHTESNIYLYMLNFRWRIERRKVYIYEEWEKDIGLYNF